MPASAAIYGCEGPELLPVERDFFRAVQPWGFILFARNCQTPAQIRTLCSALRETVGNAQAPILIDQEGGRVARLKAPEWRTRPPARLFGMMYEKNPAEARDTAWLCARLIAQELRDLGVNVDCAPVLDVPSPGAHDIIGDRAFSDDPAIVIDLGRAAIEGFLDGGVLPVIKHIPGHGRAEADSHEALPHVKATVEELSAHDFVPFRALSHAPLAMTAHVVFDAIDARAPATTSARVIRDVIRGEIGFDGFLMSDDLSMKALSGSFSARTRAALLAGCDGVLHCNGNMDEMKEIADAVPVLEGRALQRADAALAHLITPAAFDVAAAETKFGKMTGATV